MILSDMLRRVNSQLDDIAAPSDVVDWLNAAKDDMAIAVEGKFPDLVSSNVNDTFVFDIKYHEIPILYATARGKEKDVMTTEAQTLMTQYMSKRKDFESFYDVPPQYRDDAFAQQFTATAGQLIFGAITKASYVPNVSNLSVYYNNVVQDRKLFKVNADKTFTWYGKTLLLNELITAIWDEHADLSQPPYPWMGAW